MLVFCVFKGSLYSITRTHSSGTTDFEGNDLHIWIDSDDSTSVIIGCNHSCHMCSMTLVIAWVAIIIYKIISSDHSSLKVWVVCLYSGIDNSNSDLSVGVFKGSQITFRSILIHSPCITRIFSRKHTCVFEGKYFWADHVDAEKSFWDVSCVDIFKHFMTKK